MRFVTNVGRAAIAAAATGTLLLGLIGPTPSAHAADGITAATLSTATTAIPTASANTTDLALTFTAPADPTITYTATATVSAVKSPVKKSRRVLPTVTVPATLTPNAPNTLQLGTTPSTSRGEYKVTVVITQTVSGAVGSTATASAKVIAYHSAANSVSLSKFNAVYYYNPVKSKLKVTATVPKYMAGAKVKVRMLVVGGTTVKTIGSGKVSAKGTIKLKTKKITITSDFYLAVDVKSRPYAEAFLFASEFHRP